MLRIHILNIILIMSSINCNLASKITKWAIVFFVFIVFIKLSQQSLSSFATRTCLLGTNLNPCIIEDCKAWGSIHRGVGVLEFWTWTTSLTDSFWIFFKSGWFKLGKFQVNTTLDNRWKTPCSSIRTNKRWLLNPLCWKDLRRIS